MKKLRLIIPVLIVCLLLGGCGFFLPAFFLNFSEPKTEVAPLPYGSAVDPKLSAEDIYYRARFAAGDQALQYTAQATIGLGFHDGDSVYPSDFHYDMQVVLSPEDCAVNVQTSMAFDDETPDVYHEYFRKENGELVCYDHDMTTGACYREPIDLDGLTPYAVIVDYTIKGYPIAPKKLSLEPQTRILNDREVYLLTFTESALYAFGSTGNNSTDRKLDQRNIVSTWYVDAETYLPVQQEFYLSHVDDLLGQVIDSIYYLEASEADASIDTYAYVLKDLVYEPVEVPEIPEDVFRKAWENAGYSNS